MQALGLEHVYNRTEPVVSNAREADMPEPTPRSSVEPQVRRLTSALTELLSEMMHCPQFSDGPVNSGFDIWRFLSTQLGFNQRQEISKLFRPISSLAVQRSGFHIRISHQHSCLIDHIRKGFAALEKRRNQLNFKRNHHAPD